MALSNAIQLREPTGAVVHSDRVGQFRFRKFIKALYRNGLAGSMDVGACGENAAVESFLALCSTTAQHPVPAALGIRQELRLATVPWIERTYHRRRRQRRLGRLTPLEFETTDQPAHAA